MREVDPKVGCTPPPEKTGLVAYASKCIMWTTKVAIYEPTRATGPVFHEAHLNIDSFYLTDQGP